MLPHAMHHRQPARACFLPPAPAGGAARISPTAQQRVALDPATHSKLKRVAQQRFGGQSGLSRLGTIILSHYLSHMERAYFGRAGARMCAAVPAGRRSIDAVIFDMDGVLCDSERPSRLAAVEVFRAQYGVQVRAEDFAPFTGTGEANFLAGVAGLYGVAGFDAGEAKALFFDTYVHKGFATLVSAFPGVPGLIARAKQLGLKTAVASAADAVKVDANLAAIALPRDTFDFVTSSDDIARKKPAPDVFLAAAAGVGVDPARCVVVEDAVAGVQAARAAGMRCVAVATSLPADELRAAGADVVREQPAFIEIADLFGEDVFADADSPPAAGDVVGDGGAQASG